MFVFVPAAERTEERKLEEQLLDAAREGALSRLIQLVRSHAVHLLHLSDCLLCLADTPS